MKVINTFYRPSSFSLLLRDRTVLLGVIEEGPRANDLKVAGNLKEGFLRVSRFDGRTWRPAGGHWAGQAHKMTASHAEVVSQALQALDVQDWFIAVAALLGADANARRMQQQGRERRAQEVAKC
jgi:hypothetical protein